MFEKYFVNYYCFRWDFYPVCWEIATIQTLAAQKRPFITRVPSTIKEAKTLLSSVENLPLETINENYRCYETPSYYAEVKQRWFVIESKAAKAKESKTAFKNVGKLGVCRSPKVESL